MLLNPHRFAISGSSDPNWGSVTLLLKGIGTNGSTSIIDSSSYARAITPQGNAQISTARSKFGTSSIRFDGSGDVLTTAIVSDFAFGSGDFTVEGWYWLDNRDGDPYLFSTINSDGTIRMAIQAMSGGNLRLYTAVAAGVGDVFGAAGTVPTGAWVHIAVCQVSGVTKSFIDGVNVYSGTPPYSWPSSSQKLEVGAAYYYSAAYMAGNIEQLRVTKGVARYTSSFTPPEAPFPSS